MLYIYTHIDTILYVSMYIYMCIISYVHIYRYITENMYLYMYTMYIFHNISYIRDSILPMHLTIDYQYFYIDADEGRKA